MDSDKKEINQQELDEAFNLREEKRLENTIQSKNEFVSAIVLTIIYMLGSTFIYGMFFYRGGSTTIGGEGIIIDSIIIGFIIYIATKKENKSNASEVVFGSLVFICGDIF
ncbi:MAG: hypothetical protein K0Q73_8922, partial [Paenibacillus sp.]|nr:hypothetical protein [Paenibacillus sp.]